MVINYFIILFVLVGLFFGMTTNTEVFGQVDTKAFENICTDLESVNLVHSINDGKVLETCVENISTPTVFMIVQANNDSQLTVEVPKEMVYAVNQNCSPSFVTIIVNDGFSLATMEDAPLSRIFTIDIPKGFYNEVEIIGSYTLGDDVHQYCGEIYGYDSQYLSPKKQVDKGRSSEFVRCNEGLELIFKYDNSPACVKPITAEKLIARGWAIS